jgi:predicted cupin superfamily sugar epimerase
MHLHHAGRVVYTLISTSKPVQIRTVVMGEDTSRGEVRQLVVDGGWWKVSEIPLQDREKVDAGQMEANKVGGLISEVVTPGFDWEDHAYITSTILHDLLDGDQEAIKKYQRYCRA